MTDCTFCAILAGKLPASIVYRDDVCCAFMDIRQADNPGHVLIIPIEHASNLAELDEETGGHLFRTAQRVAAALRRSGIRCEGVNLFLADGAVAGQDVFHVHLHIFPRYRGDGFGMRVGPTYGQHISREGLDAAAEAIRRAM